MVIQFKNRPIQRRIKIQIPSDHHQVPIISQLVILYNLKINIVGAMLGQNGKNTGWFDLEVEGESQQIEDALLYLQENNIVIWEDSNRQGGYDGW